MNKIPKLISCLKLSYKQVLFLFFFKFWSPGQLDKGLENICAVTKMVIKHFLFTGEIKHKKILCLLDPGTKQTIYFAHAHNKWFGTIVLFSEPIRKIQFTDRIFWIGSLKRFFLKICSRAFGTELDQSFSEPITRPVLERGQKNSETWPMTMWMTLSWPPRLLAC